MPFNKQFPNQFAAEVLTGTSTEDAVVFGFNATYVRVANRGTAPMFLNLSSTAAATTADAALEAGEVFSGSISGAAGLGLATASTSTGDSSKRVNVLALGG